LNNPPSSPRNNRVEPGTTNSGLYYLGRGS
jgi:hypothetical protein